MDSRKCDFCKIDVHRASYVQHLRSRKHLENEKQNEMIIPEWLFSKNLLKIKFKKHNPKSLKQLARDNIKLDDKQLNEELAKKMLNRFYFTDKNLRVGFSKGDSTNSSYKLYTNTEIIHDTIPSNRNNYLPKIYNENLLLPTNITLEQNNQVMKELNLIQ